MCEILVRIKDAPSTGDPVRNTHAEKQGDVIWVAEDGHNWGGTENAHSDWRIFSIQPVSVVQAQIMMQIEPVNADGSNPLWQNRIYYFDITKIPNGVLKNYWNQARSQAMISLPYTYAQMQTIVSKRAPIVSVP